MVDIHGYKLLMNCAIGIDNYPRADQAELDRVEREGFGFILDELYPKEIKRVSYFLELNKIDHAHPTDCLGFFNPEERLRAIKLLHILDPEAFGHRWKDCGFIAPNGHIPTEEELEMARKSPIKHGYLMGTSEDPELNHLNSSSLAEVRA